MYAIDKHQIQTDLIAPLCQMLHSLAAPALTPFLSDWPRVGFERAIIPASLPVLRWLPEAARDAPRFSAAVVDALCRATPSLAWRQTYTEREVEADFLQNYGWTELIGERGPLACERLACGILVLGPDTLYPRHRHEAEEIYLPLVGTRAVLVA